MRGRWSHEQRGGMGGLASCFAGIGRSWTDGRVREDSRRFAPGHRAVEHEVALQENSSQDLPRFLLGDSQQDLLLLGSILGAPDQERRMRCSGIPGRR